MFGYSAPRPVRFKDYFYSIFDKSEEFGTEIEGWHTESAPGSYEAVSGRDELWWRTTLRIHTDLGFLFQALRVCEAQEMADKVTLFKCDTAWLTKDVSGGLTLVD